MAKTVVITGAGKGIGLATAKKFLENGWWVIGMYHEEKAPLDSPAFVQVPLEITSPESIAGAVAAVQDAAPNIDVLVNNAGILIDSAEEVIDIAKIRETFDVNLFGLIDLTERLIPLMHSGSHIINLDSGYGAMSEPIDDATSSGYRLSKASLNMYTRILAFRLKDKRIVVSSIAPGWVKTDMGYSVASDTEKPDRKPEEAADDIYRLAAAQVESGYFWEYGKKRDW